MASVEMEKVRKTFGQVAVIHGVDLTIDHGEFTVFVGPSGCGKSTLLRMIAGLEEVSSGELRIGGTRMKRGRGVRAGRRDGVPVLCPLPAHDGRENMGFGLKMTGHAKADIAQRVKAAADILQLGALPPAQAQPAVGRSAPARRDRQGHRPQSAGVPVRRTAVEPRRRTAVAMRVEIAKLHQNLGNTMVYVTHDQTEAMTLADKIVVLRAGKVEQVGSPLKLYDDPDNAFVAGFIVSPKMNFLNASPSTATALGDRGREDPLAAALPVTDSLRAPRCRSASARSTSIARTAHRSFCRSRWMSSSISAGRAISTATLPAGTGGRRAAVRRARQARRARRCPLPAGRPEGLHGRGRAAEVTPGRVHRRQPKP